MLQDGGPLVAKLKSGTNCNSRKRNTPCNTPHVNAMGEGEATNEVENVQSQRSNKLRKEPEEQTPQILDN